MIGEEIIDPEDLVLPTEILREIFYNEEIIEMLQNEDVGFSSDILNVYRIAQLHKQDFSEALQEFINAIGKGEYSISDILECYEEDPLHLMFMT